MPKYDAQDDVQHGKVMNDAERVIYYEAKLEKAEHTMLAFQQVAEEAKEHYEKELTKERGERRDAESRAFRAEVALQEVLKFITKK